MRSAIALATTLSHFTQAELTHLFARRLTEQDRAPAHHTDIALHLLKPDNIERIIRTLHTDDLRALAGISLDGKERLLQLGLMTAGAPAAAPEVIPEVQAVLERLLNEQGVHLDPASPGSAERLPEQPVAGSHWAHSAFLAGQRCVLLLRGFDLVPSRVTRTGALAVATQKTIAESTQIPLTEVPHLWEGLLALGAAVVSDQTAHATRRGRQWSRESHEPRWLELAAAVLRIMPAPLRETLGTRTALAEIASREVFTRFPLLAAQTREAITRYTHLAETLGVTERGTLTPASELLLKEKPAKALNMTGDAFPPTAQGVYLQPDLSVIAPGPLEPEIGHLLLDLTTLANPGVATSMQITQESLQGALDRGWTVDEIHRVFTDTSLTPLPQPLEYLLEDLDRLHGSVTVEPGFEPGVHTLITVRHEQLARELLANTRLGPLELAPMRGDSHALSSRIAPTHAHAMLVDAGVHASLKATSRSGAGPSAKRRSWHTRDAHNGTGDLARFTTAVQEDDAPAWAKDLARALVRDGSETPQETMQHALELAIRMGGTLQVTVSAGGQTRDFTLQPLTISGNRLRALDSVAQLERTFSLSAITAVEAPAEID